MDRYFSTSKQKKCWDNAMYVILIVITGGYSRGCVGYSVHGVRVSNRWGSGGRRRRRGGGGRRRTDVPREVPGVAVEIHRHILCVGLWMAVAQVPTGIGVHSIRPVCRALHYPVHCCQHPVHGTRPPRNGSQIGLHSQQSQRCKYPLLQLRTVMSRMPRRRQ